MESSPSLIDYDVDELERLLNGGTQPEFDDTVPLENDDLFGVQNHTAISSPRSVRTWLSRGRNRNDEAQFRGDAFPGGWKSHRRSGHLTGDDDDSSLDRRSPGHRRIGRRKDGTDGFRRGRESDRRTRDNESYGADRGRPGRPDSTARPYSPVSARPTSGRPTVRELPGRRAATAEPTSETRAGRCGPLDRSPDLAMQSRDGQRGRQVSTVRQSVHRTANSSSDSDGCLKSPHRHRRRGPGHRRQRSTSVRRQDDSRSSSELCGRNNRGECERCAREPPRTLGGEESRALHRSTGEYRGPVDEDSQLNHQKVTPESPGMQHPCMRQAVHTRLGVFNGSTSLETFLAKFRNCREYFKWNDADQLFHLRASLDGPAGQLLWNAPQTDRVDKVIELLQNRFGEVNQAERYRAELRSRRRRPKESLQELYIDISRLMSLAYPGPTTELSEIVGRDAFLDALTDQTMRVRILEHGPTTLDEALRWACRIEAYAESCGPNRVDKNDEDYRRNRPKYVRSAVNSDRTSDHEQQAELKGYLADLREAIESCRQEVREQRSQLENLRRQQTESERNLPRIPTQFNVDPIGVNQPRGGANADADRRRPMTGERPLGPNGVGQLSRSRGPAMRSTDERRGMQEITAGQSFRRGRCFECGQEGHFARDHRSSTTDRSPTSARGVTSKRTAADVYLRAQLGGKQVAVLLDTGCEHNLCARRVMPEAQLQSTSQRLYAANGTAIPLLGEVTATLKIDRKEFRVNFLVTDAVQEVILGIPFLTQKRCHWDFGRSQLHVEGVTVQLHSRPKLQNVRRIYVADDTVIPARHIGTVPVQVSLPDLKTVAPGWVVEPRKLPSGLAGARTLLDDTSLETSLRVMNLSDRDRHISRGVWIGDAEAVAICADLQREVRSAKQGTDEDRMTEQLSGAGVLTQQFPSADHVQCVIDKLPEQLTKEQKLAAADCIRQNADVFSRNDDDIGRTHVLSHTIDTGSSRPVKQQLRRHPQAYLPVIDEHVEDMRRRDIIEPGTGPWASNVVLVRKPDSSLRFCVDFRSVNALTLKDAYPLPRIDSCLEALGSAKYFSTLDAGSAYWQVPMADEASRDRTAFVTRQGLWRFKVLPFGCCNAPAVFQRLMDIVLAGLQWQICLAFLDDVIVFASTFEEHCRRLELVLKRLRQARLKLKPGKCKMFQLETRFLGSIVSGSGIAVDPEKIAAVVSWPQPTTVTEVRAFTALAGYYRRHVKGFSDIARPLHELTRKKQPFVWGERQQDAFERLKECLVSAPVLAAPVDEGRYVVDTDASGQALGAVLQQEQEGQLRVIAYASRALLPTETAYCTTRLELLGVVYALRQFRHFLLCRHFVLRTDNAALTSLLKTPEPLAQQARWLNLIAEYDFELIHRPGEQNRAADGLSRRPCERVQADTPCTQCRPRIRTNVDCGVDILARGTSSRHVEALPAEGAISATEIDGNRPLSNKVIRDEQQKDAVTGTIITLLMDSFRTPTWEDVASCDRETQQLFAQRQTLEVKDGILYRLFQNTDGTVKHYQVVVPRSLRPAFLAETHGARMTGHFGTLKSQEQLRRYAYWYRWKSDIELFVRRCDVCNRYRKGPRFRQGPLQYVSVGSTWQKVHIDLMGPFVRSYDNYEYILTILDSFSKYLITVALPDKKATTVAQALVRKLYLIHGAVELQVSDQGTEFCNTLMASITTLLGVQRCRGTAYRPSSNGQVERVHATMHRCFATTVDENQRNWTDMLPYVTFAYNTSYHSSTTFSPFYLLYLREPNVAIDLMVDRPTPALPASVDDYALKMAERMRQAYRIVHDQLKCCFSRAKKRYDWRVKALKLEVGTFVWYFTPRRQRHVSPKWALQTTGPFKVTRKLNEVNYVIQKTPKHRSFIVHIDRLRHYEGPEPETWKSTSSERGTTESCVVDSVPERAVGEWRTDVQEESARPRRKKRPPAWLAEYECEIEDRGVRRPGRLNSSARQ